MYGILRALLFILPAEQAHHVAFGMLRLLHHLPFVSRLLRARFAPCDPRLAVDALGKRFPSPLGLAAGFDKDAVGYEALGDLGFGFVEVGTVTAQPQPGNPRPRLFRLPRDRAIVNRMGFNNRGAHAMSVQLLGKRTTIVGVNIGKTKRVPADAAITDYEHSARLLAPLADYMVVNVSSPNTPGLRDLQAVETLRPLLRAVRVAMDAETAHRVPLLVKIAPDLADADIDAIADLALELELDGIIATNTTISRAGLDTPSDQVQRYGAGGLSGAPLKERSLAVLRRLRQRLGPQMTLVSVGGIETADDVWERIQSGATLVQLYTSFVYGGPLSVHRIHQQLLRKLDEGNLSSISGIRFAAGAPASPASWDKPASANL